MGINFAGTYFRRVRGFRGLLGKNLFRRNLLFRMCETNTILWILFSRTLLEIGKLCQIKAIFNLFSEIIDFLELIFEFIFDVFRQKTAK